MSLTASRTPLGRAGYPAKIAFVLFLTAVAATLFVAPLIDGAPLPGAAAVIVAVPISLGAFIVLVRWVCAALADSRRHPDPGA